MWMGLLLSGTGMGAARTPEGSCQRELLEPGQIVTRTVKSSVTGAAVTLRALAVDPLGTFVAGPRKVIFYFHGFGGSLEASRDGAFLANLLATLTAKSPAPPIVIIISGGPFLMGLNGVSERARKHLSGSFVAPHDLLPFLSELSARVGAPRKKTVLLGGSMGAVTAWNLALTAPERFSRVLTFALPDADSFEGIVKDTSSEALGFAFPWDEDSGAWTREQLGRLQSFVINGNAMPMSRFIFGSLSEWNAFSPVQRMESEGIPTPFMPVFVTTGRRDRFGYFEPNLSLTRLIWGVWGTAHFEPFDGDHAGPYPLPAMADFMLSDEPESTDYLDR